MFTQLASILEADETLSNHVTKLKDGRLKVVVMPKPGKGANPGLGAPLLLTATPEELDEAFTSFVADFVGQRTSLKEQAAVTATLIAAAKEAESTKGTKALQGKSGKPAALPAPVSTASSEDGDDDDSGDAPGATSDDTTSPTDASAPPAVAPAAANNDDLLPFIV